jgi:hypothetical protein
MNEPDISKLIDGMELFAETMAGIRAQLINKGFSEPVAELLVVEVFRMQVKQSSQPEVN